jgi:hypothetical protein
VSLLLRAKRRLPYLHTGNEPHPEQTETERERERERDRETERQRDRETERQRDRETERQRQQSCSKVSGQGDFLPSLPKSSNKDPNEIIAKHVS